MGLGALQFIGQCAVNFPMYKYQKTNNKQKIFENHKSYEQNNNLQTKKIMLV